MLRKALPCLLAASLIASIPASFAHQTAFNLGSKLPSATAGSLGDAGPVAIRVGNQMMTVVPSTALTAAEQVALQQVLDTGRQTIILNVDGTARGGVFQLNAMPSAAMSGLVIPKGVTGFDNASSGSNLMFTGDLVNAGNLMMFPSGSGQRVGELTALDILNMKGGSISSPVAGTTLSLNAVSNFTNYGSITSAGDLSIASVAGNFTNAGLISSTAGNINISAANSTDINFNNTGGTLQALAGNINFRDPGYQGQSNINITGGNLVANSVNISSGAGNISANVDTLQGVLNVNANCAHVTARTNQLDLGDMNITGDPTFYNPHGSILITGNLDFPGQSLAIVAEQNITSTGDAKIISTASSSGNGGSIIMIAGARFALRDHELNITGRSSSGGSIDLSQGEGITEITTASANKGSKNGGDVTLIAYSGSSAHSGEVILPGGSLIFTGGHGSGTNGDVNIGAGAQISVGSIKTETGNGIGGGGGDVRNATGNPLVSNYYQSGEGVQVACVCPPPAVKILPSGALDFDGTWFTTPDNQGSPSASVTTGNISGANIGIQSTGNISTGSIQVGGPVDAGGVGLTSSNGNINVNGGITANSNGGISVTAGKNLHISGPVTAPGGGNGGDISLVATNGQLTLTQGKISANAGSAGGNGGDILLQGNKIDIVGTNGGAATGVLQLSANGTLGGDAGSISVVTTSGGFSVGHKPGDLAISAVSGAEYDSPGTHYGVGGISIICCYPFCCQPSYTGKVYLSAGRNLNVDSSALKVGPNSSSDANGAKIMLIAGTGSHGGMLSVKGSLSANGTGSGNGGYILLASSSKANFDISPSASNVRNGVAGNVTAVGFDGGTVIIASNGEQQIAPGSVNVSTNSQPIPLISWIVPVNPPPVIFVNPPNEVSIGGSGSGGSVSITISGSGSSSSWSITLSGSGITITPEPVLCCAAPACCIGFAPEYNPGRNGIITTMTFTQASSRGLLCCAGPDPTPVLPYLSVSITPIIFPISRCCQTPVTFFELSNVNQLTSTHSTSRKKPILTNSIPTGLSLLTVKPIPLPSIGTALKYSDIETGK